MRYRPVTEFRDVADDWIATLTGFARERVLQPERSDLAALCTLLATDP